MSNAIRNIYTRITGELEERLKIAAAKRRLKQPAAIAEAIERWVEASETGIAAPKASKGENTGQALSGHYQSSTEGVVLGTLGRHQKTPGDMVPINTSGDEPEWVYGGRALSSEEILHVEMLLEILRGGKPGMADFIKGNLLEFRESLEAWRERSGIPVPVAADPNPPRSVGELRAERDSFARDGGDADLTAKKIDETVEKIQGITRRVEGRKTRHPRKTGGGGNV